jgi:hypothetical protein
MMASITDMPCGLSICSFVFDRMRVPVIAAESPGYLLLHPHHSDVPLSEIVVEGNLKVSQISQSLLAKACESFHKIACFASLEPSSPARIVATHRRWVGFHAAGDNRLVATLVFANIADGQSLLAYPLRLLYGLLALQKKANHLLRPGLASPFIYVGEFPNVMGVAQRMRATILHVGLPIVMYRVAFQAWQYPYLICGGRPAPAMWVVGGELLSASPV